MINNKELNMKEHLKMIFRMDLENMIFKMDVLIKEYFNLGNYQNLDILLIQMETNSLDFIKMIKLKESD